MTIAWRPATAPRRKEELLTAASSLVAWYERFGRRPSPVRGRSLIRWRHDRAADARLIDAVRHDLRDDDGQANATAVRMIWTGDHLDAARRLQAGLVAPVRAVKEKRGLNMVETALPWRVWPSRRPVPRVTVR